MDALFDANALLTKQEELLPELTPFLEPVSETSRFPMLRHPLLYSVPYMPAMNALLNAQFKAKQESLRVAKLAKDWATLIMLHERPYRVEVLHKLRSSLKLHEYWPLLAHVWVDSENLEHYTQPFLLDLLTWRRGFMRERMMETVDLIALGKLPQEMTVYHGYDPQGKQQRLSWTTEHRVAKFFATRYGTRGRIFTGTVNKKSIYAYLTSRNEAEVIVHPRHVTVTADLEA